MRTKVFSLLMGLLGMMGLLTTVFPVAFGQRGGASISGVVLDQTQAAIPEAKILIKSTTTGLARDTLSTKDGAFAAPFLPVGTYDVTVSKSGFRSETRSKILLTADQVVTLKFILEIGGVAQSIEVTSGPGEVDTATGTINDVVTEK